MPSPRIAIGSIFQESNEFVKIRTELDLFRNTYVHERQALLSLAGTDCEVAGMLAVCESEGATVIPLVAARCVSGGPLSDDCYSYLKNALLTPLREAGPVDGVLLSMHGSMVTVSEGDPEGDLLAAIRVLIGPDAPVVMTLDLHAHVTPRMVTHTTGLVSFTHYPHDDTYTTGERGARLLFDALNGRTRPVMALAKVPLLAAGCRGMTFGDAPMAHLTHRARELERTPGVLSISCFQIHPNNDQPGMGSGAIVITDNDPELARRTALSFAEEFWSRRFEFEPEVVSVAEAVARGREIDGPVVLVDTADCPGGGAPEDSVALLRELLALGVTERCFTLVVDPVAAEVCAAAGIGQTVSFDLGYGFDSDWGQPLPVTGVVRGVCDGRFLYTGGAYGGTWASMGLSATLKIGSIEVLIMSQPTYDWWDEQYRSAGMDVRTAKFIGIKNPMNYQFAYRDSAKASFIVDTPGPTPANIARLPHKRLQRPFYPKDKDIPNLEIPVVVNREWTL